MKFQDLSEFKLLPGVNLVLARSTNWKLTQGDVEPLRWVPDWDKAWFEHLLGTPAQEKAIIVGSKTFRRNKKFFQTVPKNLVIVMSSDASRYAEYLRPGVLEFWSDSPGEVVSRLLGMGKTTILLLGGAVLAHSFFEEDLVDFAWISVIPQKFESGVEFDSTHFSREKYSSEVVLQSPADGSYLEKYTKLKIQPDLA